MFVNMYKILIKRRGNRRRTDRANFEGFFVKFDHLQLPTTGNRENKEICFFLQ